MNTFFKTLKSLIAFLISLILVPFLLTLLNLVKLDTNRIIIIIIGAIMMFIIGIITGKNSKNKGYLKGLLVSVIGILILVILSLILKYSLNINSLIYYIILIISTIFGSMLGINKRSKN